MNPMPSTVLSPAVLTNLLLPAQTLTIQSVTEQVAELNSSLVAAYHNAFNSWLENWNAYKVMDPSTAPAVPFAWVLSYFMDPTTGPGKVGIYGDTPIMWAYPAVGPLPVCDPLPIPPHAATQVTPTPLPDPVYQIGDVMDSPAGDPWPVGHILTDPATGNEYEKKSHGNPFSPSRVVFFYERVK
jgi:hypothetical protein